MWDLESILKINNEAQRAFEKKNAYEAHQRQEKERRQGILEQEIAIFDGASFVRSMYDGKINGHTSHSETRDQLPE